MGESSRVQTGSSRMPAWDRGVLPQPPAWGWKNWATMLGPGLLSAGAAIGGGEWLMGPVNTARYGGAILWVTTISILAQVVYNIEISRYTLYTGEPVMIGKFRTLPGPLFWLGVYLVLDAGSLIPYQAANCATPAVAIFRGDLPSPKTVAADRTLVLGIGCAIYILTVVPLLFSGKIYSFLKALMAVKLVVVFGLLTFLAVLYSSAATWGDILSGFFMFGTVPVTSGGLDNIFCSLLRGDGMPVMDPSAFAALAAYAAIAGVGGLKNSVISNYTRDQGWGMGAHVGAIPSIFRGRNLQLSHVGTVFEPDEHALPQWRGWVRHVTREQLAIWMTGALVGVALPAMLSVEFLPRGTTGDNWAIAAMTAGGVREEVGGALGVLYWYMLMVCALLVLLPNTTADADGTVRRWVDLAWTAVKSLRRWDLRRIGNVYFWVMAGYVGVGVLILLFLSQPKGLVEIYGCIANFALGFSCLHVLAVNLTLLPRPIRPGWLNRVALFLAGAYFLSLSIVTLAFELDKLRG